MIRIIYDGECPFCVAYTSYTRLKAAHGRVELVDARTDPFVVEEYAARGHEIDDSFIVEVDGRTLTHGAAMAFIHANLAPRWTGLWLLANPRLLDFVYPALRGGRSVALGLLGRGPIRPRRKGWRTAQRPVSQ